MLRVIQIFILSLWLTTSSFSLNDYLSERLTSANYNQSQFQMALKINNVAAKYIVYKESIAGSLQWLNSAKFLARKDKEIAWQLALFYQQKSLVREHLYWANHAFKLGATSAIIERAKQLALTKQHYQQAKNLLHPIESEESRILQVTLAVKFADFHHLQSLLPKLMSTKEQVLLKELFSYQVLPSIFDQSLFSSTPVITSNCKNSIQFFATNLPDLTRLTGLFSKIQSSKFFKQQFCFKTPKYIGPDKLQCGHHRSERINCDVELIVGTGLNEDIKYIGVLGPKGVANVNNGVVYIDQLDSQLVLEHELLHLIGFIDEYPLNKLNTACEQQGALAKNVINIKKSIYSSERDARAKVMPLLPWKDLIKAGTPISYETPQGFRLGTPENFSNDVGLFVANTCKNYQVASEVNETFKPVNKVTQLQYFEEHLPLDYESITKQVGDQFDMPSYHYNIGKKYQHQGDFEQANFWFEKASGVETTAKENIFSLIKPQ
ncbi:hypothetical protein RI844_01445 [Thalassotalea fonticola]|uniref:Sel1 repeat family protein n=1 Tax=Thalassotalea fonticola TaxID=3065649 RepID=A0ABZ0GR98_9GAMM|nr:hypothetical protein RI844_01445 [Colwelliaceae bacterium S1-1]